MGVHGHVGMPGVHIGGGVGVGVGVGGGASVQAGFNIPNPGTYVRTTQTYTASYNRQQPYTPPVGIDPMTAQFYNQASAAFRTYDTDLSGSLSFPEFEMAMRSLGFPFQSPQHAMQIFQTADLDKSGTIGEREFCEFFVYTKRQPAPMQAPVLNVGVPVQVSVGGGVGGLAGVVSLRGHHGHYVCGEQNHSVIANRPARAQWEAWTVVPTNDGRVAFRSHHGKLLCAEQNHSVIANRDAVGPWESWTPIPLGGNNYAFRSHHGKFLCAEPSGLLVANRDSQGPWEVFAVEPHFI